MTDKKYTKTQLKESKLYAKYGYILETVLEDNKKYSLAEVDKKFVKYIGKKV